MKSILAFLSLIFSNGVQASEKNHLELLFYSAPRPLNWSSPTQLVRSTIASSLSSIEVPDDLGPAPKIQTEEDAAKMLVKVFDQETLSSRKAVTHPHAISHVNVRIHCADRPEILIGSTGKESNGDYIKKILFGGAAMETLVTNTRGGLYTNDQVNHWLQYMRETGWMHSLSYEISDSLCDYLEDYIKIYQESGQGKIYGGLQTEPLGGVGAGCSAFAMSVLKVAGLYDRVFDVWFSRSLRIPHEIMNLPGKPSKYHFFELFLGNYSRWAKIEEPHTAITFWDPQLMYDWARKMKARTEHWWRDHEIVMDRKSIVIKVDAQDQPAPKQPFRYSSQHLEKIQAEVKMLWGN